MGFLSVDYITCFSRATVLRVVIINSRFGGAGRMQLALQDAGFHVLDVLPESSDLYKSLRDLQPDAIIIDADAPSRDTLEHLAVLGKRFPKPMIMMADHGSSDQTRAAAEVGVSAYVVEGLAPAVVRSLIEVAILNYHSRNLLHAALDDARQTLDDRLRIDRAKCLLMERHGFSEKRAYTVMRRLAMRRNQKVSDFARAILNSEQLDL